MSTPAHCMSRYEVWHADVADGAELLAPIWEKPSDMKASDILGDTILLQNCEGSFPMHAALEEQLGPKWQSNWFYHEHLGGVRRIYCCGPISFALEPVAYFTEVLLEVADPRKWYAGCTKSDTIRWDPWRVQPIHGVAHGPMVDAASSVEPGESYVAYPGPIATDDVEDAENA